jgi:O-antigen/teichoic acid export membrane protein
VANFLLIAVLARLLPSHEFGTFAVAWAMVAIGATAGAQWIVQSLNRFNTALQRHTAAVRVAAASGARWSAAIVALAAASSFALYSAITARLDWVASLGVAANSAIAVILLVGLGVLQASFRSGRYSALQMQFQACRLIGALGGALALGNAAGALAGAGGASALALLWSPSRSEYRQPVNEFRSRVWARRAWRYGWPFLFWSLFSTVLAVGDRIVIGILLGNAAVGGYSVHYALVSGVATMLLTPILLIAHPSIMRRWSNGDHATARRLVSISALGVACCGILLALGAVRWGRDVSTMFFGGTYADASNILPVLCLGVFSWHVGLYAQKPLEADSNTAPMVMAIAWALGVNLMVNVVLIPRIGLLGAAVATAISYTSYTITLWPLGWSTRAPVRAGAVAFAAACYSAMVFAMGWGTSNAIITCGLATVALLPGVLWLKFRWSAIPRTINA